MQRLVLAVVLALAGVIQPACGPRHTAAVSASRPCHARLAASGSPRIRWVLGPAGDRASLDSWCYGVGPALAVNAGGHDAAPPLDEVVVVTWNAHVGQGDVAGLVAAIREGRLSDGRPARHFVLLVQEALRSSSEVPVLAAEAASADAIGDGGAQGIAAAAAALDLSFLYIPSMRNGRDRSADRGNAILSTLPLHDPVAIELPFTRQRRVAIGATVGVQYEGHPAHLLLMNVHLDPLGPARALWIFGNPRQRQMATVLDQIDLRLQAPDAPPIIATVLGGDLNVLSGGVQEAVYADARRWATSVAEEDPRSTHLMGRLDYLFFRFPQSWRGSTRRGESRFGSDHYPVAATFFRTTAD